MKTSTKAAAAFVIESLGGRDKANAIFDEEAYRIFKAWERDTATLGRVLRAHLFVEHFLGEYLAKKNPPLGALDAARLTFAQKVALVGQGDRGVSYLIPGIRRLNAIRNRIAHQLRGIVTPEDAEALLQIRMFKAMRDVLCGPELPSADPVDVLEDFSKHSAMMLQASSSPHAEIWAEAIRRGLLAEVPRKEARDKATSPKKPQSKANTRKRAPAPGR